MNTASVDLDSTFTGEQAKINIVVVRCQFICSHQEKFRRFREFNLREDM